MMRQGDLSLKGGRTLHFYDHLRGADEPGRTDLLAVFWQHGTPNIGAPPAPLLAAERLGLRFVGHDRPGYGASSPLPGRDVASAADVAGLAPFGAPGLDWYAGMYPGGAAELRAAAQGREALTARLAADAFDPEMFTPADHAALAGDWAWFHSVVGPATAAGPGPMIDDDLAYVAPWGFDPVQITCPVLLLHGEQDRIVPSSHSRWLAGQCASAELRLRPDDGHLSVLYGAESALEWLRCW